MAVAMVASPLAFAEPQRVRIGVGGQASIYHLPLAIAVNRGYFQAQQLEVEVIDFAGGGKAMQALLTDAVDVLSGAFEHSIRAQARGMATQAFVLVSESPQIAMAVSLNALPDYRSLTDLRGKKIGISAPGSSTQMVASLVLGQAGIAAQEVSFIGLGTGVAALEALRTGKVDALVNSEPLMAHLEARDAVRIVADTRTPAGTAQLFGGPVASNVLLARNRYIDANPQTVQRLTNAMLNTLDWLRQATPDEITAAVPESWLMNNAPLYQKAFSNLQPSLSADGRFTHQAVTNLLQALHGFDQTLGKRDLDPHVTWTNRFVDNADRSAP